MSGGRYRCSTTAATLPPWSCMPVASTLLWFLLLVPVVEWQQWHNGIIAATTTPRPSRTHPAPVSPAGSSDSQCYHCHFPTCYHGSRPHTLVCWFPLFCGLVIFRGPVIGAICPFVCTCTYARLVLCLSGRVVCLKSMLPDIIWRVPSM